MEGRYLVFSDLHLSGREYNERPTRLDGNARNVTPVGTGIQGRSHPSGREYKKRHIRLDGNIRSVTPVLTGI